MTAQVGGSTAYAETMVAYWDTEKTHFFSGRVEGKIADQPIGQGFGWDPIFIPQKGAGKTFASLGKEAKNKLSMRSKALHHLATHLRKLNTINKE